MNWIETDKQLPPQGKKVLCLHNVGDISVRMRFKDDWIPFPFIDSLLADSLPPELWANIEFPRNLTGLFRVIYKGVMLNMDQYEEINPNGFNEIHEEFVDSIGKPFTK